MKQIVTAAIMTAFAGFLLQGEAAQAQTALSGVRTAQASHPAVSDATDFSARRYHRRYDHHGYQPYYRPHYYARPYYYRPYPYPTPVPFVFGFGFGPFWW